MSMVEQLSHAERARQLRDPTGATGLAVADILGELNRDGNLRTVEELDILAGAQVLEVGCGTGSIAKWSLARRRASPTLVSTVRAP